MSVRTIKHGLFTYWEPVSTIDQNSEEVTRFVERMVFAGATVDIPREADIKRGEEFGAFWTEEELKARSAAPEATPVTSSEGTPVNLSQLDNEELVDYLMSTGEFDGNKKPTAKEVVTAVGDDPALAQRVLDAESKASGGEPRKGVQEPLTAVAEKDDGEAEDE